MASPRGSRGSGGLGLPRPAAVLLLLGGLVGCGAASPPSGEEVGAAGGGGMLRGVAGGGGGVGGAGAETPRSRKLAVANESRYTWNGCKCKKEWKVEGVGECTNFCCNPDNDIAEWCLVEDIECEDSDWGLCKQLDTPSGCQDSPPSWVDAEFDTCSDYTTLKLCTKDGEPGSGWDKSWGTFADFANQGHTAATACCACGGGVDTSKKCHDKDWKDRDGDGCEVYSEAGWCDHLGGYGPGWHEEWGTFKSMVNSGIAADDACCACGGGDLAAAGPERTQTTLHVTLLGCDCKQNWQDEITGKVCQGFCCNPDNDPNGAWCLVADRRCEDSDWGYCREAAAVNEPCVNTPAAWLDSYGYDCADYEEQQFCTSSGAYGTGWHTEWGHFDTYFHDGHSAVTACCACGGGAAREDLEDFDRNCQDKIGWTDLDGDSCASYSDDVWCSSTGGYGSGWHEEWGSFAGRSNKNLSAPQACCACGGGSARDFKAHPNAQGLTRDPAPADAAPPPPASGGQPSVKRATWNGCECKTSWKLDNLMNCENSCCNPDGDPLGNWCVVKDPACEETDWGYCVPTGGNTEHGHGTCKDIEGWTDREGDGCWTYEDSKWCSSDGTAGPGWEKVWGSPADFFYEGHSAVTACCVCGGGDRAHRNPGHGDLYPTKDSGNNNQASGETEQEEACLDTPGWKDADGDACAAYESKRWCSPSGTFGLGWHEEWGNFRGQPTAFKACCYCGGGSTNGYSWNVQAAAAGAGTRPPVEDKGSAGSFGGAAVAVVLAAVGVVAAAAIGGFVLCRKNKEEAVEGEEGVGANRMGRSYAAGDL